MKNYRVSWEIELSASSLIEAAREALKIQRDPESLATVFSVIGESGATIEVDLASIDDEKEEGQELQSTYCGSMTEEELRGRVQVCEVCRADFMEFYEAECEEEQ